MRREAGDASAPLAAHVAQVPSTRSVSTTALTSVLRGRSARRARVPPPHAPGRRREPGAGGALAADGVAALRRPGVPAASVAPPDPTSSSIPRHRHAGSGTRVGRAERCRRSQHVTPPRSAARGRARHAADGNAGGRAAPARRRTGWPGRRRAPSPVSRDALAEASDSVVRGDARRLARYRQEAGQGMAEPRRSDYLALRATLHVAEQPGRHRSPACRASASAGGSSGGSAPPCRSRRRAARRSRCW